MIFQPEGLLLLALAAGAAYLQTQTGFAFGLILVGAATITGLAPVSLVATVSSVAALFNLVFALRGRTHRVRWHDSGLLLAGMIPGVVIGVTGLAYLTGPLEALLHDLLGLTILLSGALLVLRPDPRRVASGAWSMPLVGSVGGLLTGLFGTGGPPLVYHMYRQPHGVPVIRATLLATFSVACFMRIVFVGIQGGLTLDVLALSAGAVPIVIAVTLAAHRFPLPMSDRNLRRFAFILLMLLGGVSLLQ